MRLSRNLTYANRSGCGGTWPLNPYDSRDAFHVEPGLADRPFLQQPGLGPLSIDRLVGVVLLAPSRAVGELVDAASLVAEEFAGQMSLPDDAHRKPPRGEDRRSGPVCPDVQRRAS